MTNQTDSLPLTERLVRCACNAANSIVQGLVSTYESRPFVRNKNQTDCWLGNQQHSVQRIALLATQNGEDQLRDTLNCSIKAPFKTQLLQDLRLLGQV